MADNFQLPVPATAGDISAADEIGGVKFQRVKLTVGADGVNDGDVSAANPLPVSGTQDDGAASSGKAMVVAGITPGGVVQILETNGSGHLHIADGGGSITVDGTVAVSNFPATQAVSAASLPLPTGAATETTLAALHEKIATTPSGALLTGTARDRFFDNFADFDTVDTWEVLQTGTGMAITGPLGGAAAGSSPYLNLSSGTTANQKTVILSRATFSAPFELRYQITASQRIANNRLLVGFVQVDEAGDIVTSTSIVAAPDVLNARNAVMHQHDGTTATTSQLRVRAAGSAVDTFTNAFGTGFTTVATGSTPNFLSATTYGLTFECNKINSRAYGTNVLTNTGGQFSYDRVMPNPTARYKLCIILENQAAPASNTDWRLHLVNVMDAARFDVSPRNPGSADAGKAFPVNVVSSVSQAVTLTSTTVNPVVPATPYILNSAASTNEALILTGTSGLQAFYATNIGATVAFVKLYNKATAPISSDIPAMILSVPAAVSGVPGVCTLPIGFSGFRFALGLGIRITGAVADNDTTAVAAGQVKVMLSRTV
jgi:hypothetical protein